MSKIQVLQGKRDGDWVIVGRYWVNEITGQRVPVIALGGPANTVQNDRYAFGDDDDTEALHSLDTQNTNRTTQAADVTFLIRIEVQETAGGTDNLTAALYAQKNGSGGFLLVPYSATNNGLRLADDTQSRADDENTTNRLTGGSGTFTAGKYDDGTSAVGTSAVGLDADSAGRTEFEFAIQIDSANATDSDYWELRVEWLNGTDLDGYPGSYPTVTASILSTPEIDISDGLNVGDSASLAALLLDGVDVSDGVTVADTPTVEVSGGAPAAQEIDVSDGVELGESTSITALLLEGVDVSDGVTVGESASAAVSGGPIVGTIVVDEAVWVEITEDAGNLSTSVSDGLNVGDSASLAALEIAITAQDDLVMADAPSLDPILLEGVDVSDGVTVADAPSTDLTLSISVSDGMAVGESTSGHVRAPWYHPEELSITVGSITSGALSDTWGDDGSRLQLAETTGTPGFSYTFIFYDVPATAFSVDLNGYYEGNPGHNVKIYQYNFTTTDWTALTAESDDFPSDTSDQDYEFPLFGGANYIDSGELRLKIEHTSAGSNLHSFWIDNFQLAAHIVLSVSDGVTVGDSASLAALQLEGVDVSDGVILGESVDLSLPEIGTITVSVSDAVTVGESTSLEPLGIVISEQDDLTVGESTSVSLPEIGTITVSVSDAVTVGESTSLEPLQLEGVDVSDGVILGESATVSLEAAGGISISVSDGITLGESTSLGALILAGIVASDGLAVGEDVTVSFMSAIGDVVISDTAIGAVSVSDSAVGAVSINDTAVGALSIWDTVEV